MSGIWNTWKSGTDYCWLYCAFHAGHEYEEDIFILFVFFQNHSNFFFQRKWEFRQKLKSAAFFLSEIQNSNQNIPHNRKEFGDTMLFLTDQSRIKSKMAIVVFLTFSCQIPYARHYNPRFVYFLPHFTVRFIIKRLQTV